MEKSEPAPETEVKPEVTPEAKPAEEVKAEAKPEAKAETIGDLLETKEPEKTVPEAAFLKEKKERKALEKRVKELEASVADGATDAEVSADIDAIGKEFNVDNKFLKKLASAIEQKAEERMSSKLKPLEARERAERIERVFGTNFDKAMAEMPEYADVVNRNVIKTLSLDPANASKSFPQLIEETYGRSIPGRRTLETTTPRGGKALDEVDVDRAGKDGKYLQEVLSNPDSRRKYNDGLIDRIAGSL